MVNQKFNASSLNQIKLLVLPKIFFITLFSFYSSFLFLPVNAEENDLSLKQMLLSPGDLTQAHAEIETKCESCHVHFDKSNQTPLCLNCHEKIQNDLSVKQGFHGHLSVAKTKDCKSCHTDHQGREFNINGLDTDHFDHNFTNFKLEGHHVNLGCDSCHVDEALLAKMSLPSGIQSLPVDKGFRFKGFECISCHADFHQNEELSDCGSCHNSASWKDSKFDHDTTKFSLDGTHGQLECSSCHSNSDFKGLDIQCQSCHLSEDSHLGIFGTKCEDCHQSEEWKNDSYDHLISTGFELKDSHLHSQGKDVKCIDCHSEKLKPKTQCVGCHLNQDVHQGSNGQICQDCHNEKSWKVTDFSHDQLKTGFELTGAHEDESCDSCHIPGIKKNSIASKASLGLVRGCVDCHQVIDPHLSKLGTDCASCHQTEGWQTNVRFNHDFTDFPLNGSHQLQICESCHLSSSFAEQSSSCISCHQDDDIHQKTLGGKCEACHDTSVWSHWTFDHQQRTNFPLNGSHQNLECGLCHSKVLVEPLKPANDCYSCHRADDVHNGGFGVECQQCHSEQSFEELDL